MIITFLGRIFSQIVIYKIYNEEKYISFSKKIPVGTYIDKHADHEKPYLNKARFLDSAKFVVSSLEKLVGNLR